MGWHTEEGNDGATCSMGKGSASLMVTLLCEEAVGSRDGETVKYRGLR